MFEHKSAEAEKNWLLSEVNKDLSPGHRILKVAFCLVAVVVVAAAVIFSSHPFSLR